MRSIQEILETQRQCKPGNSAKEIIEITYKIRNDISLTAEEQAIWSAYTSH